MVLAAPSEAELVKIELRLLAHGLSPVAIRENDGPYAGQLMALGLAPMPKRAGRVLSSLPLLREGGARQAA